MFVLSHPVLLMIVICRVSASLKEMEQFPIGFEAGLGRIPASTFTPRLETFPFSAREDSVIEYALVLAPRIAPSFVIGLREDCILSSSMNIAMNPCIVSASSCFATDLSQGIEAVTLSIFVTSLKE